MSNPKISPLYTVGPQKTHSSSLLNLLPSSINGSVFLKLLGIYTRLLTAIYRDILEGGLYPYKNTAQIH
jgi:hypothetical protein